MPIIWGGQGGGKTKNLESLMAPLGSFFRTASVTELQGQFDYKLRTNCFGVLFDELSGIEKVDSNTLKDTISGVMVGGRKMYSADAVGQARRANFIACTNSAPPHGLKDSTGARRFWSMPARGGNPSKARMDFFNDPQRIAAIWGCIDVGAEQYYGPLTDNVELMHAVRRRQDELLRTHSTLEAFLEAETVKDPEGRMSLKEFAAYYHQWANSFGRHIASPEDFRQTRLEQALTHLGYSIIKPNNRAVVKGLSLAHDDEIG
jgi:predicted P-loop ATPase